MTADLWQTDPARATELVVEEVHRSPAFTENGKAEIIVRLLQVLRNWEGHAKLRCPDDSTPMTREEKAAVGLKGNVKMDRVFWEALSPAGRDDPVAAAEVIYHRALGAVSIEGRLRSIRSLGFSSCTFRSSGSWGECNLAKRLDRKKLKVADIHTWPPDGCTALWCPCLVMPDLES